MKNAIRCCISCILPCGSLDVIRIVHANGRVEEISGTIKASDIMEAYPKHILKKPSTFTFEEDHGLCPKIVVVSPDDQLQRGKIYFLMPAPITKPEKARSRSSRKKNNKEDESNNHSSNNIIKKVDNNNNNNNNNNVASDKYLSDILSEKTSATQRDRRRGRSNVWRPHLDSICETPIEAL